MNGDAQAGAYHPDDGGSPDPAAAQAAYLVRWICETKPPSILRIDDREYLLACAGMLDAVADKEFPGWREQKVAP